MKRYTITDLVIMRVFGFLKDKNAKEFYDRMQPLETIVRRIYSCDQEGRVTLESKSYSALFDIAQFESVLRYFKDADMFLANSTAHESGATHLLVFALSNGFFAVLTPFRKDEQH